MQRRVQAGGHDIPSADIFRRHAASAQSVLQFFVPRMHDWQLFNSAADAGLVRVADGGNSRATKVYESEQWQPFLVLSTSVTVRRALAIQRALGVSAAVMRDGEDCHHSAGRVAADGARLRRADIARTLSAATRAKSSPSLSPSPTRQ